MITGFDKISSSAQTEVLTSGLKLKLLGNPGIYSQACELELPSNKAFAMLVYLALRDDYCTRKDISEFLWGTTSSASVRVALSELRNLPNSKQWLETKAQLIKVNLDSDARDFEEALKRQDYNLALSTWQKTDKDNQSFLKNFEVRKADEFMNWLELERSRLNELYLTALQSYTVKLEKEENYKKALEYSQLLLQKDQLNEDAWRAVIRLEHKQGNTEKALEMFEQLRETLKTELKVEPLPETLELLAQIEQGSVSSAKIAILIKNIEQIPARPEQLIGRDDLLQEIDESLKINKRLLLHGFGGTGKSALVASYASRFLKKETGNILWLQAGDDTPESLFDTIAKAFDAGQKLSQAKDKALFINKLLVNKIKLFILDDVWNAYALSKIIEAIPADVALVVTSRQRYPRLKRIDVGRLNRKDGLELVNHYANFAVLASGGGAQHRRGYRTEQLSDLCELLGDHAFSLRIAGITLAVNNLNPKELLQQVKDNPHTMKIPSEFADQGRESASSLLSVSIQKLSDPAYEALMAFGAMYSSSSTPELLALSIRREEEATEDALIALQKAGLAERQTEAGSDVISYRLHDLVFSFAKANSNLRELTTMNACKHFLEIHKQDFDILDAEISNMLGASQTAKKFDKVIFVEMLRLLVDGNAYYQARGHSPRSIELLKNAINAAKDIGDLEAAHYLLSKLGNTYRELFGDLDKALVTYKEALDLAQKLKNHHRETILLCVIGSVRIYQEEEDAEYYLDQAYKIAKKRGDNNALSQILANKGYIANTKKDFKASYKYLSEAVLVAREILKSKDLSEKEGQRRLFFALLNIGDVELELMGFDKALESRRQALIIAQESDNQLWMAYALQEIGEIYHSTKKQDLANENYNKALYYYQSNNAQLDFENLSNFMKKNNYKINLIGLGVGSI